MWGWIVLAFAVGVIVGFIMAGLARAAGKEDRIMGIHEEPIQTKRE